MITKNSKFLNDLRKLCKKISNKKNDVIVFQTDIVATSVFYKLDGNYIGKTMLNYFEKNFFKKTILFPAFSNDFIKKKYDIKFSKPSTGVIPNIALLSGKYYRTESLLHSFLIKGKKLNEIKSLKQKTTWGEGSVFDWLYKKDGLWVSLNLNLNRGCAIHHMAEEKARVPYRFYKLFKGKLYDNGKFVKNTFEKKYCYYKKFSTKLDYNKWVNIMKKKKDFDRIIISPGMYANISTAKKIVDKSYYFYKRYPFGSLNLK